MSESNLVADFFWHSMATISLFIAIDFLGVFTGAFGGVLAARRNPTCGGSVRARFGFCTWMRVTRDLFIQRGPPLALLDVRYLYAAFLGALLSCSGARV
jgi:uncharacterized membrane protein YeiH